MRKLPMAIFAALVLAAHCTCVLAAQSQRGKSEPRSRRSQRIRMEEVQVASPDGKLKLTVLPNAERLAFTVALGETTVLEPSPIGMQLDGYDLSSGVVFEKAEPYEVKETYPWWGAKSLAVNHCNGMKIDLQNDLTFDRYVLELRAYNDGVAFRHVIPGEGSVARVPDEYTAFVIPEGSKVWYHGLAGGHYEDEYKDKRVSDVQAGEWAGPPITFKLPGKTAYGAITEANLVNYAGMGLQCDGRRGWVTALGHRQPLNYPFELRYGRDEAKRLGKPAAIQGTIVTPWRVVLVGRDLNTLVNSTVIPNLCPPPDPQYFPAGLKTAWIKPGRAVWRYLDGGGSSIEEMKEFSRLAGQLGFEYHVLEGFWSRWSDEQIKEVVDYSKKQGVGLWFWQHSNQLRTTEAREEFFKKLHDWGVAGAKIDFLDHEAKEIIDHYEALTETAAKYQIMVNFHGANKPTGRARTWPNELVREAVRGMENSTLKERARHETILPFTRFLAGHADYTSMHFGSRRQDTTVAHQIATAAIFGGPLLTLVMQPQKMLDHPAAEMIKSISPVWDETLVLPDSEIGELAAYARRTGGTWFLAVVNGPGHRTIKVPLSFLGKGDYAALYVRDANGKPDEVVIENTAANSGAALTIAMPHGGGFIGRFVKK